MTTPMTTAKLSGTPVIVFYSVLLVPFLLADVPFIGLAFGLVSIVLGILLIVFCAILDYRLWKAIPGPQRSTSPGLAVGLMFVPFFNLYWVFVNYVGMARSNRRWQCTLYSSPIADLEGFALARAIFFVLSWTVGLLPFIGMALTIADFVIFILYYTRIVRITNHLREETQRRATPPPALPPAPATVPAE